MSNNAVATANQDIIQSLVINGDLSKMDANMKVSYYKQYCERLGLDPFTQPFKILRLNGKEVLYCDRSGTQQLNKLHKVSHLVTARETVNGCFVVTARASSGDRETESIGAVPIENLKGEALCNAMMKAETKAKRRSTLDLLGLGILDESETDSIPGAVTVPVQVEAPPAAPAPKQTTPSPGAAPKTKVTDAAFKAVCDRLANGETDVYDKAIAAFSLTEAQLTRLNEVRSQLKPATDGSDNSF